MDEKPSQEKAIYNLEEIIYKYLVEDVARETLQLMDKIELSDIDMFPIKVLADELKTSGFDNRITEKLGDYVIDYLVDWEKISQGVIAHFQEIFRKFESKKPRVE